MKNQKSKFLFGTFIKSGLTVLISVLIIYGVIQAGTITPPSGTPTAQFYTLSEIYEFIANNTTATEGGHSFTFSDSLAGTSRTLTEIYDALANLISADQVKLGTTYLNVAGALIPSGGTATTTNVLSGKIYFGDSQINWTPQIGAMPDNGNFSLTASSTDQSVAAGYYSGGTLAGDANLVSENITDSVNIFGVIGNLISYLFGSDDASQVLTSAGAGAGIYDASNLTDSVVKLNTTFATSSTGSLVPFGGTATTTDVLIGKTYFGDSQTDWNLQTGTMINVGQQTITPGISTTTITQGYHDGAGYCKGDANFVAGNIKSGVDIFGISGTFKFHTGQTASCGTGDDADIDGTSKSYNVYDPVTETGGCGAGTVLDNYSGLCWQKNDQASLNWDGAIDYCYNLTLGGHSDWHLPNIIEGITMLDYSCDSNAPSHCHSNFQNSALTWICGASCSFWLSTTYPGTPSNSYTLYTGRGYVYYNSKARSLSVRCVRR